MRTAVVILNWNTKEFLERFLPSLSASMPEGAEVIVADNGSTDGSVEVMREKFQEIKLICFDKNYGFTGGYNLAFKALRQMPEASDMEYFVLINSDIEVAPGWLEPLISWMDTHPDCAACAPKLHSWQDRDSFEYAGAAGGLLDKFGYPFCRGRVLKRLEKDNGQYDSPANVFWATGACLMVRSDDYEKMGGLDERFFAHMEEIDLCWRLQLEGRVITVVPDSVVYHVGGGTLPNDSPWKLKLNYRNNLLMLGNNLAKTYALEIAGRSAPGKAAAKAVSKARRTIFLRKCLDGCSAMVYLLTGKAALFKAVTEAHKEYRGLASEPDIPQIEAFLEARVGVAAPLLFPRWIVPLAMAKGNGIFAYLRKRI
ncbi:MAG: glycosyltransferase family 2 protein [Bacteroidales bacterium]|nr:glycosyltransferase family 2 protein [Bacteroidales bacterium]